MEIIWHLVDLALHPVPQSPHPVIWGWEFKLNFSHSPPQKKIIYQIELSWSVELRYSKTQSLSSIFYLEFIEIHFKELLCSVSISLLPNLTWPPSFRFLSSTFHGNSLCNISGDFHFTISDGRGSLFLELDSPPGFHTVDHSTPQGISALDFPDNTLPWLAVSLDTLSQSFCL